MVNLLENTPYKFSGAFLIEILYNSLCIFEENQENFWIIYALIENYFESETSISLDYSRLDSCYHKALENNQSEIAKWILDLRNCLEGIT